MTVVHCWKQQMPKRSMQGQHSAQAQHMYPPSIASGYGGYGRRYTHEWIVRHYFESKLQGAGLCAAPLVAGKSWACPSSLRKLRHHILQYLSRAFLRTPTCSQAAKEDTGEAPSSPFNRTRVERNGVAAPFPPLKPDSRRARAGAAAAAPARWAGCSGAPVRTGGTKRDLRRTRNPSNVKAACKGLSRPA